MKFHFLTIAFTALTLIMLSSCGGTKRDSKGREDFSVFIEKFYSNESFQMERIDFPIIGKTQADGRPQIIEKEQWKVLKPIDTKNPDYVVRNIEISEDLIEQRIIVKQAFVIEMQFTLDASKEWYLTSYSGVSGVSMKAEVDPALYDTTRSVRFVHPDSLKKEQEQQEK